MIPTNLTGSWPGSLHTHLITNKLAFSEPPVDFGEDNDRNAKKWELSLLK